MNKEFHQKAMEEIKNFSPEKIALIKQDFEKMHEEHVKERLTKIYEGDACYNCWFNNEDSIMCRENHENCQFFEIYGRLKLYEDTLYKWLNW